APALRTIEKESGREGIIVRPLSAALLPPTKPEIDGLIKRENLGMIRGRSRKEQLKMAQEFGFDNPPNAGGGCLLTDPAFSIRTKDLFHYVETPNTNDIDLLKIGRHFRFDEKTKFIVGRHKDENEMLKALALPGDVLFETKDHVGPVSVLRGDDSEKNLKLAAAITLRYSDAPKDLSGIIMTEKNEVKSEICTGSILESEYLQYRI
ncbi:MAG: tRNA (5-methylaminomethyl-2-thiouridylate)-methyltransferase, partial [Thaumarchaeota archaeon]|nr:tRNA (5-methylaminomethyl-2-thiouridylate)-methyltransferase [Nitrososphaerota archaeon]